jgi:multimeric flavodoxin WrbA
MTKVLGLYYSSHCHLETMAEDVAEGARSAGAIADIRRVPELDGARFLGSHVAGVAAKLKG